ncbi:MULTISPECIES: oxidoreductase [unclassified Pseudovibrio]|uniref:oxidoreductase n=1 Tax=unclassified Pseudovibrio TaxID=2627060 RepID=UPI0007AE6A31|nr:MULTISPECIES: oxidoreductase [unclassified Pseudovibrio]KZK99928.1 Fatty acyl-CoA reductase [Pseudovibrio sp. W74]KZL11758.1 Fatty acyl-CoA reductase [Pseudovibrio sp. Ad14]
MQQQPNNKNSQDLTGKTAVVTGGNVGLGFQSALELAESGAHVVIACRSVEKGETAMARIHQKVSSASLEVIPLDLTDRDSIHQFAQVFSSKHGRLDILLSNAGVVNLKELARTKEGWEMHFATNHLGHFLLTGLLFETLVATPDARVVTVSSGAYKAAKMNFDDLHWENRPYARIGSYAESKLANLLFMSALQRRFDAAGSSAKSMSAHPGLAATERQQSIGIGGWLSRVMARPVSFGARPQMMAATAPDLPACTFLGPRFGMWGSPSPIKLSGLAIDEKVQEKLWAISEELTEFQYPKATENA